jgi:hypothetical protein
MRVAAQARFQDVLPATGAGEVLADLRVRDFKRMGAMLANAFGHGFGAAAVFNRPRPLSRIIENFRRRLEAVLFVFPGKGRWLPAKNGVVLARLFPNSSLTGARSRLKCALDFGFNLIKIKLWQSK